LTFGMRPPCQAGDRVNGVGVSGGSCCGLELIGEHGFSFGIKSRREGARTISAKLRRSQKWLLQRFRFSGIIGVAQTSIFPGLAGTPARLHWRVRCFWVSFSE